MKTPFGGCCSTRISVSLKHYTFLQKKDGTAKTPISGKRQPAFDQRFDLSRTSLTFVSLNFRHTGRVMTYIESSKGEEDESTSVKRPVPQPDAAIFSFRSRSAPP